MMNKKTKKDKVLECKIQKIIREDFYENSLDDLETSIENIGAPRLSIGVGINFDKDKNLVSIIFNVDFFSQKIKNKNEKKLFGIITRHQFSVRNLNDYNTGEGFSLPDDFLAALLATSISGTRGMLVMSKTNPAYSDILIPMIDVYSLLDEIRKNPNKDRDTE